MPGTASNESGRAPRETDGSRLARMGTDAAVWARELVATAKAVAERERMTLAAVVLDPTPGDFLHVWLCNAIEAGRRAGYEQGHADTEEAIGYGVVLPADFAGSELAADSAGSPLAANPAGSDPLTRIAEALERIAATVAPGDTDGHGGWAAPYVRVATP